MAPAAVVARRLPTHPAAASVGLHWLATAASALPAMVKRTRSRSCSTCSSKVAAAWRRAGAVDLARVIDADLVQGDGETGDQVTMSLDAMVAFIRLSLDGRNMARR